MSYVFYFNNMMLPVTPSQLQLKVKNQNKTINLINDGEINLLKKPGLTEITFKALFPNVRYPFAQYKDGFRPAAVYLEFLERLKVNQLSFQFIVTRTMPNRKPLFNTNIKVSLEDYKPVEDADNGFDVLVDINLKQFRSYGTRTVEIKPPSSGQSKATATVEQPRESDSAIVSIGSTVMVNGRLHRDSYGEGPGKTLSNYKGKINFVNEKGSHPFHVTDMSGGWLGWVLKSSVAGI